MYLAVTGEDIVLQNRELRNVCRFEAWERQVPAKRVSVRHRWGGGGILTYCCHGVREKDCCVVAAVVSFA